MTNSHYMMRLMSTLNSKYVQPGFEFKHALLKPKSYYQPSVMHLKFCNGYERKYNIGIATMVTLQKDVKMINEYVEFERALQG